MKASVLRRSVTCVVAFAFAIVSGVTPASSTPTGPSAPTGAAENAACGVTAPDLDNSQYGKHFLRSVSIRSGPSWTCDVIGTATTANLVDYHCWTYGDDGTTWTYLRTKTTVYGWVWDSYLMDQGSSVRC